MTTHVPPFWSYRPVGEGLVRLTNHVSGASAVASDSVLEWLERVQASGDAGDGASARAAEETARALRIAFDSPAETETWLRAHDAHRLLPVIDQIELTNHCPYTCRMCPRTTDMTRPLGFMSTDLFLDIVRQVAGHQDYVALHHFGESLLHRALPTMVRAAADLGVRTGLSCNPPSLAPPLARALLEAGVANLLLSLDALDTPTYRTMRGVAANFERAQENVRELMRLRDELRAPTVITLQMIRMHGNEDDGERFLDLCARLGVDRGVVIRLGRWDFSDEKMATLGQFSSPGYTAPCDRPRASVAVLWDGRVVPCCHDYDGAVVLGDLSRASLEEVWGSPAAARFRAESERSALCGRCAFSRTFRERQREAESFRAFHRARDASPLEWVNPASPAYDRWFSGFDLAPAGGAP